MNSDHRPVLPCKILGAGRALPRRVVSSAEIDALCQCPPGWTEKHTGVQTRHWADEETAVDLGAAAARQALATANCHPSEVDLLVNASGTPHQAIPDGGPLLQRALGLGSSGRPAFSVHATCLSFLLGMECAARWLAGGTVRRALIITAEAGSVGLNLAQSESTGLIGDGAAAVLLGLPEPGEMCGIEGAHFETYGDAASLTEIRGCGTAIHPTRGSHATDQLFHMDGKALLRFALQRVRPFLERLRPGLSTGPADADWLIPHQASKAGLDLLLALGWPADKTLVTLPRWGNCIAASLPLTLVEGIESGRIQRGHRLILAGTGAGVSLGGLVLRY